MIKYVINWWNKENQWNQQEQNSNDELYHGGVECQDILIVPLSSALVGQCVAALT